MSIYVFHPDKNAERVCTHKLEFATARTISFGAPFSENTTSYFSRNDAKTLSKYRRQAAHHALIRRSVLSSQQTPPESPAIILSTVSAQCLL